MAATHDRPAFDIGHPAPDHHRVGLGLLMSCLFAAPALWSLQHLVLYAVASHYCGLEPAVAARGNAGWLLWLLAVVNLAALVGAALALALSLRSLHRTRREYAEGSDDIVDAGEGRTRFLSIWAVWLSALFLLAIAFNTISVFWIDLCGA
jgi:hypothetical protein